MGMGARAYREFRHRSRRSLQGARSRQAFEDPVASSERLLAIRSRSIAELRRRLVQKGIPESVVASTISDLCARGLLNDARFARAVIESALARKPVGPRFLAAKLHRYLVPQSVSADALAECLPSPREEVLAQEASEKKLRELRRHHRGEARQTDRHTAALYRFLLARGFSRPIVQRVIGGIQTGGQWDKED